MGKIYFASDLHLGVNAFKSSHERELIFCQWLEEISEDADRIFLLGDLFDFWFEYGSAVPKGFTRTLGALAKCSDSGIKIDLFTGNHDLWMKDYLVNEIGIKLHYNPIQTEMMGRSFFIGHGDGLGPGDHGYKIMKKIFVHPVSKFLYRWLHPDIGIPLASYFSSVSRKSQLMVKDYLGHDKEWLISFVEEVSATRYFDYFIFGHRHLPIDYKLKNNSSRYINTGDWLVHQSYAEFDGQQLNLRFYKNENGKIYS